jgi:hypothetical protein
VSHGLFDSLQMADPAEAQPDPPPEVVIDGIQYHLETNVSAHRSVESLSSVWARQGQGPRNIKANTESVVDLETGQNWSTCEVNGVSSVCLLTVLFDAVGSRSTAAILTVTTDGETFFSRAMLLQYLIPPVLVSLHSSARMASDYEQGYHLMMG